MLTIDSKFKPILLEALEEYMFKLSLELDNLKGQSLTPYRKELTNKQQLIEELQHLISVPQ
ncbi:MAG TPA: hypothetical protein PKJ63_06805 [Cyclobacteriaceae bacterium]|nr:hypothetical protein [Cyclobacteriaceae bacterium]HRW99267.1 hypothetical protein [Cyclobacteriaceae bacterium]